MGAGSKAKPRSGSKKGADGAAPAPKGGLDALSEAIESGAGLPAVVRAAAGALGVQLGGANVYFGERVEKPTLGDPGDPLTLEVYNAMIRLMYVTSALGCILAFGVRAVLVD